MPGGASGTAVVVAAAVAVEAVAAAAASRRTIGDRELLSLALTEADSVDVRVFFCLESRGEVGRLLLWLLRLPLRLLLLVVDMVDG